MIGWANQWRVSSGVCRRRVRVWRTLRRQHRIRARFLATVSGRHNWRSLRPLRGRIAGHLWEKRRRGR